MGKHNKSRLIWPAVAILTLVFGSFTIAMAEQRGMMSDEEMEKMMKDRSKSSEMGSKGMMGGGMGMMGMMQGRGGMGQMGQGMMCMMHGMGGMGGMGMMGGTEAIQMLDLSDAQRSKVKKIRRSLRKKNWPLMGQMMDEMETLRELYAADTRDSAAIGKVYSKIFDLKRQMIEASIDAGNQMEQILNKKQREQMKRMRRGGMMGGGMGMMGQ